MDERHFDGLVRRLGARRTVVGALLAGLLLPLEMAARGKNGKQRKQVGNGKNKDKKRTRAQAEPCWRAGACIPKKGANVSRCDLAGYNPATPPDCTGCNLSRANLRGANLSKATLTKANLSGSCLVDATLSGATISNTTNLYNATFCRTIMPDGSTNNSGCGSSTACCPTCNRGIGMTCGTPGNLCCDGSVCQNGICVCIAATCQSLGACGQDVSDGCGGTLSCGMCAVGATPVCNDGVCAACAATCPAGCGGCANHPDGTTTCGNDGGFIQCGADCSTDAECPADFPRCLSSFTYRSDDSTQLLPPLCNSDAPGVCTRLNGCSAVERAARVGRQGFRIVAE